MARIWGYVSAMTKLELRLLGPIVLLCAAVAAAPAATYGQEAPVAAVSPDAALRLDQYVVEVFTIDDGLPSRRMDAIAQTPDGYLWFGTHNGLARFDGVTFTTFNVSNMPALPNSAIRRLATSEDGSLWIAPYRGGLVRYHRGYATRYGADEGLPAADVMELAPGSGGTLWIGMIDGALLRFNGEHIEAVAMPGHGAPRTILSIHEDQSGAVWLASPEDGVYRYHQQRWELFGRAEAFNGREIQDVGVDGSGHIWAAGTQAIFRYAGERFTELELPFAPAWIRAIIPGPDGLPWIGGQPGIFRPRADVTEFLGEDDGLPDDRVRDLFVDRAGSVWVATFGGLACFKKGRFTTYTSYGYGGEMGGFTRAMLQTRDGAIWGGGGRGLGRFLDGRFEPVTLDPDIRIAQVWSLAEDGDGSLWVGTTDGLVRTDGTATRVYTTADGLPSNDARVLHADTAGNLWVGFRPSGLGRMVDGRFERIDGLNGVVRELYRDQAGLLWIGLGEGGVLRWDGKELSPLVINGVPWESGAEQFYEDAEGMLWVTTIGAGLWRIRGQSATNYTAADGLLTDSPRSFVEDDGATFWVNSDDGIFSIRRRDLDDFDAGRIAAIPHTRYSGADGLAEIESESRGSPGAIRTADGRLWFTMIGGKVAVADPTPEEDLPPGTVHIEELRTGNNEMVFSNRRVPTSLAAVAEPGDLELSLGVRDVEIDYTATGVGSADHLRFRYQLVGYDRQWVEAGERRIVRYTALPPGDYEFRVIARIESGVLSEDDARISFSVPAYFYETLWFQTLVGLAVFSVLLLVYGMRTRDLRQHAVELRGLVGERDTSLAELDRSHANLENALEEVSTLQKRLERENVYLREEIKETHGFSEVVGTSKGIRRVLGQVEQVAATDTTVLILGETGTGKELVARAIHNRSHRQDRPMVRVNCAALPESLIESELFGHEKGAFTGAAAKRQGRFELADGGTLFLDEIGDLSADLQAKLLRVLQEGEFERVGGTRTLQVDVRVITATNHDLTRAIAEGRFREDLFYRLNVFSIGLPSLRERREDIPLLVWHFAEELAANAGKHFDAIPAPLMDALVRYDWRGNVRELRNVVERAVVLSTGPTLRLDEAFATGILGVGPFEETPVAGSGTRPADGRLDDGTLEAIERNHISSVLERCNWKVSGTGGAAEALGLKESSLRYKMKKLGIRRPG
jgi:formate hydrogenlyase transcriptional activator